MEGLFSVNNITGREYHQFTFSDDGQKLYGVGYFGTGNGYVDEISISDAELTNEYIITNAYPADLFFKDNQLMVVLRINQWRSMVIRPLIF